ncbi:Transcriptional regulator, TraR/DksA family [Moritella viscosa]|uniref:TraR/DksA C4-type zinc finger protein n=1 Tax=Moritella viscosa TaxID=80854 RepID=UPI000508ECA9|nr:TraR/DksA C4-type zinc finger protein [Moritella viscosa]CED61151.1 putative uncharacterized phage gene [Moritella viscosa]SHN99498.1 Transcriptional regulator, TraR/DksA family [Moritella viscosa]SHO20120.1 Transcriptional regulator, TraR/DksA family [Moritella viscosa]
MDIYDNAAKVEESQRQQALDKALRQGKEPAQQITNAQVHCLRCDLVIPPLRLAAKPDAAYCIHCQQLREMRI